jgi:hypothetical protein
MNLGETFSHTALFGSSAAESHRSVSTLHDVDDLELIARHDKHMSTTTVTGQQKWQRLSKLTFSIYSDIFHPAPPARLSVCLSVCLSLSLHWVPGTGLPNLYNHCPPLDRIQPREHR